VDTLKSLAVVTLLGAVLYGVYVVASKPEKPLPEAIATQIQGSDAPPIIESGTAQPASTLTPPTFETPRPIAAAPATLPSQASQPVAPPKLDVETGVASSASPYSKPAPGDVAHSAPPSDPYGSRGSSVYERTSPSHVEPTGYVAPAPTYTPASRNDTEYPTTSTGAATSYEATPYEAPATKESAPSYESARSSSNSDADIEAAKQRVRVYAFHQAWKTAQDQVSDGHYREALLALSAFYNDSAIPEDEREALLGWLDALAAKVIYSTEHLLEEPYVAHRSESLYTISEKYHVPYLLLKNINGVRDPEVLIPGTKLKVVPGPFRAEIDLKRSEITLFVQNLYAGRFPFTRGSDPVRPGEYKVEHKDPDKEYRGPQGEIAAKDPRNPYGGIWIDLGNDVCIHGSPGDAYTDQSVGCICLAPRDAEDVFAILSAKESVVVIK
jgi:LysM repeat protein